MFLRMPESWPRPVVAVVVMVLLGVLDLAGSIAAKEAVDRRSLAWGAAGALIFLAVFWVYLAGLAVAGLAVVTLGWIVVVQVGVVVLDRYRYGEPLPRGAWVVVVVLLVAQAYLMLAPRSVPAERSARSDQGGQQVIQAGAGDGGQPGDDQRAARHHADQQDVPDRLMPGFTHVSPPSPRSAPPTETPVLTESLPVTE
jgi:hypothetical protein